MRRVQCADILLKSFLSFVDFLLYLCIVTGPLNHIPPYSTVMDLALAQRQRRDLMGPRPALNQFLFAGD